MKQLRRDMAANPKKAAALGLMVLVAIYFWGPLLWKWAAASGNKRSSKADMASLILTDDPVEPTQQAKARGGAKFRWDKVRQLIEDDPYMRPAVFDPTWTNPFGRSAAASEVQPPIEQRPEVAVNAAVLEPIQPAELGLVLNSIFIGPRSRVATINGEPCYEGEALALSGDEPMAATHQVRLVRINRHSVTLEINGKPFSIELSQPKLARGDEIGRAKQEN